MTEMLDTSLEAYESIRSKLNTKQSRVEAVLKKSYPFAMCNYQIASELNWPINCVTGRIKELRKKKLVVGAGKRPGPPQGRSVHFWSSVHTDTLF